RLPVRRAAVADRSRGRRAAREGRAGGPGGCRRRPGPGRAGHHRRRRGWRRELTEPPGPFGTDQIHRHSRHHTEGTPTMAKLSTEELLDAFKEMTLIELSEFVKQFEETFNVTAAAPVAVAAAGAPAAGGGGEAAAAEEQDEFDVILEAAGDKKIQVIKEV